MKLNQTLGKDYMIERVALNGEVIDDWYSWKSIKSSLGISNKNIHNAWCNEAPCFGYWFIKKPFTEIESKLDNVVLSEHDYETQVFESSMNFTIEGFGF